MTHSYNSNSLPRSNSIHKSAFRGNFAKLKAAIELNSDFIFAKDFNGATPLHHAAYKGHFECAQLLLQKGALVDAQDKDICTPLHNAAFTGEIKIVILLVQYGANVNHQDIDKATPLHKAAFNGKLEIIKVLVNAGADVDICDNEDISAIQKATFNDHFQCLSFLISRNANVNGVDKKGSTTLHKAAFNGNIQCVQVLLEKGVNINAKDKEHTTPLHSAVYNGHTEVVNLLLNKGADCNCYTSKYKSTPLHFAAFNGFVDCIKLLLDKGAPLNAKDVKGLTPLHYAVKREHEFCVEYLLYRGADVDARDVKDRTWKDMTNNPTIIELFTAERKTSLNPNIEQSLSMTSDSKFSPISNLINNIANKSTQEDTENNNGLQKLAKSRSESLLKSTKISNDHLTNSETSLDKDLEIYRNLDKFGFISDEPEEQDPQETEREINRALKWSKMLPPLTREGIQRWNQIVKKSKKVKIRCEKGIPARVRGQAWKLLSESTPEQISERKMTSYKDLLSEDSIHVSQINRDINRTFPKNILLMTKGGQDALFNVLKANSIYNKETGYCQGMGFVTALLLMYMEEEDAFWVLVKLCTKYEMESVWKPGLPGLPKCFFFLDRLLEENMPKVHRHMKELSLNPSLFSTEWFMTVFLYNLPFQFALRIWDIYLFEGFHFIFAVGLALIKIFHDKILQMNFEDLFQFMKMNHLKEKKTDLDVEELIKKANSYKEVVKRSLKSLNKQYEKYKKNL